MAWIKKDEMRPNPPSSDSLEQLSFSDDLIAIYMAFKNQIYNAQSVLYPSCAYDASPARVFDQVTFVDIEDGSQGCVRALQREGLQAHKQDIRDYVPQNLHDLLILLNPAIVPGWASQHLKQGGYVIANDYHKSASVMHEQPDQFTLWGTINFPHKNQEAVVSQDTSGLFVPVQSEDEFKELRPADYDFASKTYPHMLKTMGITPASRFEEMYVQFRELMDESTQLPSKRVADRYIFVKK